MRVHLAAEHAFELELADAGFESRGITLDFSGGLNGKGFQFINPNASRTCGCGESFSI